MFAILSLFSTDSLIEKYAAYRAGELQFSDDEIMILEEELIARPLNSAQAWELLGLLRGK
jgi:hypothetical protein